MKLYSAKNEVVATLQGDVITTKWGHKLRLVNDEIHDDDKGHVGYLIDGTVLNFIGDPQAWTDKIEIVQ